MPNNSSSGFSFGRLLAVIALLFLGFIILKVVFTFAVSMLMWAFFGLMALAAVGVVFKALISD